MREDVEVSSLVYANHHRLYSGSPMAEVGYQVGMLSAFVVEEWEQERGRDEERWEAVRAIGSYAGRTAS